MFRVSRCMEYLDRAYHWQPGLLFVGYHINKHEINTSSLKQNILGQIVLLTLQYPVHKVRSAGSYYKLIMMIIL